MGYTAVKGGLDAINAAEALIAGRSGRLDPAAVGAGARLLIDQVMGEAGLYAPELAALAIAQVEGDPIEAAFLLRAFRSTLPRLGYTLPADGRRMRVLRRISATFKEIPGGQLLGKTRDYTQRLLDLDGRFAPPQPPLLSDDAALPDFPSVVDTLRDEGMVPPQKPEGAEPFDITRDAMRFPAPRSARLQALARGETGFMVAVGYSAQRGLGAAHPVIAELRSGELPLQIRHPLTHDPVTLGAISLTEIETINHTSGGMGGPTISSGEDSHAERFDLGYGVSFGRHERKAIAMGIIDISMNIPGNGGPAADEEFVLLHCDALESSGFVEHIKLPHYVTFQSALDRVRFRRLSQLASTGGAWASAGTSPAMSRGQ
jgi:alpha-D-ribose 1-methylphosphonate 5-triphosphate synthase subunit PhnI